MTGPCTIIHGSLSVRGVILRPGTWWRGLRFDGRRCTSAKEAREVAMDLLAEGTEFLPIGKPCDGFDPKTGCPGHPAPASEGLQESPALLAAAAAYLEKHHG